MGLEKNLFEEGETPSFHDGPRVICRGRMRREKTWECQPPFHECAEILFCVDGTGTMWVARTDQTKVGRQSDSIKDYIDKNYRQAINLDTLSEAFYISKSYISHQFKKDMGMSPIDYLIKKRIEIACYLLLNTDDTVTEVAGQVGYENPLYFSALFKKHAGVSPTEYRRTRRREGAP